MILRFTSLLFRRSSSVLFLSFCSLLIGGFLFGVVFSFTKSAQDYLISEGKVLAGGDIILTSPYPIDTSKSPLLTLQEKGYAFSYAKNFQAVFTAKNGTVTTPAAVRLVDNLFPLYGEVVLQDGKEFTNEYGGIYVEQAFIEKISASVGDKIFLGETPLTILGVLEKVPDEVSLGVSFTPRVIIVEDKGSNLGIDLSQSRISYKLYIGENGRLPLTEAAIKEVEEYAKEKKLRFDDATNGPNNLIRGLSSVDNFIGIVLSIALFLVVINILANLVYVLTRFRKTIALLKVYGATALQIECIYVLLLGFLGALSGGLGACIGWYVTQVLLGRVESYLSISIVGTSGALTTLLGALFGLVFVIISALPFLFALRRVDPKELLLGQAKTAPQNITKSQALKKILYYSPIPISLIVLLYLVSGDVYLSLLSVLACGFLFLFFMTVTFFSLQLLKRHKERFSFILKSIISFLSLRNFETIITTASIMTAFSGVFIVAAVQQNINTNLVKNVAATAPSMYLVDITKSQLEEVKNVVGASFTEYPIVRGRLLTLNNKNIAEIDNPGLRREFNMTYRENLIAGEKLVSGTFNAPSSSNKNVVSIDKEFGNELGGVSLGDTISVFIQGVTLEATVTSIREVDSTSGIPFFYLVFPPSVLASFPASYFGTADLDVESKKRVEQRLGSTFPNIIPIDTKSVLDTLRGLLATVVTIVTLVGIPSIVLGVLLVLVMLYQSLYERSGDVLVLRAFGFTSNNITKLFIIESVGLSLLAGIIAYIVAHLTAYILNIYLFSFTTFSFSLLPLYIIGVNTLLVSLFSYALSQRLVKIPLKRLLAEK